MRGLKMARGPLQILGEDVAKPLTEGQGKAAAFSLRSEKADKIINSMAETAPLQPGMIKRYGRGGAVCRGSALALR